MSPVSQLVDDLLASASGLLNEDDPIAAEMSGAALSTLFASAGDDGAVDAEAASREVLSLIAQRGSAEAQALLLALASVADGPLAEAATAGAARLRAAGIAPPNWAGELDKPVTAADCQALRDTTDTASMLSCVFHRAGRSHGVIVMVDDEEHGAAADILLLDAPRVTAVREIAERQSGRSPESLNPAEFRGRVERALDARAMRGADFDGDQPEDDDGPAYLSLSVLLRARMRALPAPTT